MSGSAGALFWLILSLVFFIIEGLTVQLVTLWFAIGALAAMVAAFLGAPYLVQLVVFLLASVGSLFLWRPVLKGKLMRKRQPTNADMVIGSTGLVLEEIDTLRQTGRVRAINLDWSARTETDRVIPAREKVRVLRIEGVTLIVEPLEQSGGQAGGQTL